LGALPFSASPYLQFEERSACVIAEKREDRLTELDFRCLWHGELISYRLLAPTRWKSDLQRSDEAADHADVKSAALMMDGSAGIPAFWIAMTKGEEAASPDERFSLGSLEATKSPITKVLAK
jgi:hypothetical protein